LSDENDRVHASLAKEFFKPIEAAVARVQSGKKLATQICAQEGSFMP